MELRQYQKDAISQIRSEFSKGNNCVVLCAPTGSGKTVIFSEITRLTFENGKKVLIITNRKELLSQTGNKLLDFGISPIFLNQFFKLATGVNVIVAMVETLKRRLSKPDYQNFVQSFDLIIIDECHINCFNKIFENVQEKQKVIGCSATPQRKNPAPALECFYDSIVNVCQVSDLIKQGFLSYPVSYGIPISLKGVKTKMGDYDVKDLEKLYDDQKKYTGAVDNYKLRANGKKAIVFCASILNSEKLVLEFVKENVKAKHFDCYMSANKRAEILDWFYNTKDAVLCNVGILTTGFDCPDIECVILYRATKSLPLFLQMVGRGSRIAPLKKDFIVLDFGSNIQNHGFWESDRVWNLKNPEKSKIPAPVKECPKCGALIPISIKICNIIIDNKICGYVWPSKEDTKKIKEQKVILQLLPSQLNRLVESGTLTVIEYENIRELKNYKVGWVLHKFKTFNQFKEYEKIKNYKSGWAEYQWRSRGYE